MTKIRELLNNLKKLTHYTPPPSAMLGFIPPGFVPPNNFITIGFIKIGKPAPMGCIQLGRHFFSSPQHLIGYGYYPPATNIMPPADFLPFGFLPIGNWTPPPGYMPQGFVPPNGFLPAPNYINYSLMQNAFLLTPSKPQILATDLTENINAPLSQNQNSRSFPFFKAQDSTAEEESEFVALLTCPITGEIFKDPVTAEDGRTYERSALQKWYTISKDKKCPFNLDKSLGNPEILPTNIIIKQTVKAYEEYLEDIQRHNTSSADLFPN
ncbi:U-box domain-containing protein [Legionella sp.]|uniref:U-box domain-containing protein n=1 Tax=Legionella sp. TaxID=459 RepID=UPI003220929F